MEKHTRPIGMSVSMRQGYEEVLELVTAELKKEGFGVLTEIDVKATLKKKIDVDFRPYKILGACNPPLAYRALSAVPDIGMLLPCNVTVSLEDDGSVLVNLLDPKLMSEFIEDPALEQVAVEAREKLSRVAVALGNIS